MIGLATSRLLSRRLASVFNSICQGTKISSIRFPPCRQKSIYVGDGPAYTFDVNENSYIYKYVREPLKNYSRLAERANSLPIYHLIRELIDEYSYTNTDYSSISSVFTNRFLEIDFPLERQYYNEIKQAIRGMNQQELAILLSAIQSSDDPVTKVVMQLIDLELKWLLKSHANTRLMDCNLWFYIADVFYEAQMNSSFVDVLVNYLSSNEVRMSKDQLYHLLFLVNLKRQRATFLHSLKDRLVSLISSAEPGELAIVCLAYFKTETPMQDKVLTRSIIERLDFLLPKIDPSTPVFCAIMKTIRFSNNFDCRDDLVKLFKHLHQHESRIYLASPFNLVQTIRATETYRIYVPGLAETAFQHMLKNLDLFRLKDIQMVVRHAAQNNLRPNPEELDKVTNFLLTTRKYELFRFPGFPYSILLSLAFMDYFNPAFYNVVQTDEFLDSMKRFSSDKSLRQAILTLYVACRMRAPDIDVRIPLEFMREVCEELTRPGGIGILRHNDSFTSLKYLMGATCDSNIRSNRLKMLCDNLKDRYKDSSNIQVTLQYTLAHQRYPDLIVSQDSCAPGNFDATELMPQNVHGNHVLVQIHWDEDMTDNEIRPRGGKMFEVRIKEQLGYKVIALPAFDVLSFDYKRVSPSFKDRIDFALGICDAAPKIPAISQE